MPLHQRAAQTISSSKRSNSAGSAGGTSALSGGDKRSESTASGSVLPHQHRPLGSAERSETDRQLHELMQYELQRKSLKRLSETCPFKPRINGGSSSSTNRKHRRAPNADNKTPSPGDKVPRHHHDDSAAQVAGEKAHTIGDDLPVEVRLLEKGRITSLLQKEMAEAKKRQEEAELSELFKPALNPSDPYRQKLLHPADLPVEERLLHYGRTVEESRKQMRDDREAFERKQLLEFFRPSLLHEKRHQSTFLTRAETKQNDREKHIGEIRSQQSKEYTFKPSISRLSQQLAEQRRSASHVPACEVLHEDAKRRQQELELKAREAAAIEANREVYHPTTNPASEQWIHKGQHRGLFVERTFVERQQEYLRVHAEHQELLRQKSHEEERHALDAVRASTSLQRVAHNDIQRQVDRLYYETQELSKEAKERMARRLQEEECPFRPAISVGSEAVVRRSNIERDVVRRLTQFRPKRTASAPVNANDSSLLSAQPHRHVDGRKVDPADAEEFYRRQVDSVQRTHKIISERNAEKQLQEQLECTFRPKTNSSARTPTPTKHGGSSQMNSSTHSDSVASVQGFSEFMKRREAAKKLEEEKQRRLEALGKGMQCNGPNFTVMMPFKLSEHKPVLSARSATDHPYHHYHSLSTSPPQRSSSPPLQSDMPGAVINRWRVNSNALRALVHNRGEDHKDGGKRRTRSGNTSLVDDGQAHAWSAMSKLHDDRVPRMNGHTDPFNSERLLAAAQRR